MVWLLIVCVNFMLLFQGPFEYNVDYFQYKLHFNIRRKKHVINRVINTNIQFFLVDSVSYNTSIYIACLPIRIAIHSVFSSTLCL